MADDALSVAIAPLPDLDRLADRWRAVEARAKSGFFTGWTWIGSWLRATGARPDLLTVRDAAGGDIAFALVGRGCMRRRFGAVATLYLNEAGDPAADRAFVEYNGPACIAGREAAVADAIGRAIGLDKRWRATRLSGVVPGHPLIAAIPARRRVRRDSMPVHHVDLAAVRACGDYPVLLSANSRSQLRRSAREYGDAVAIVAATDPSTITAWLAEMHRLNEGRHADNAWDTPLFRAFAAEIARAGLADGSVELLRASAGDALLGYLLNFRTGGVVMNYQSAFAPPISAKAKPGLTAHAAAIAHHAAAGRARYSFLAGRDRYKQSLSTGAEAMEWWSIERFHPVLELEYWARRLFRRQASRAA